MKKGKGALSELSNAEAVGQDRAMKFSGKAHQVALKLILWSFLAVVAIVAIGYLAKILGALIVGGAIVLVALWGLFAVGIYFYFRDPETIVPVKDGVIVSPACGRVVFVDECEAPSWLDAQKCRKIVIKTGFLDVPMQYAPDEGTVKHLQHLAGEWQGSTDATRETLEMVIESPQPEQQAIALKLVAGRIGRRIITWVPLGEPVERGQRLGLMQLGKSCEIYLPPNVDIKVKEDDVVKGGETILAERT